MSRPAVADSLWAESVKSVSRLAAMLLAVNLLYATPKYVFFEHIGWSHFPLLIVSKALAMSAVELVVLAMVLGPLTRLAPALFGRFLPLRKWIGLAGFGAGAFHVMISLAVLNPAYYKKLFDETGRLTGLAEMGILMGILSFLMLTMLAVTTIQGVRQAMVPGSWRVIHQKGVWVLLLLALHNVFIGVKGWLTPEKWTLGWMPPVTLLTFAILAAGILVRCLPWLISSPRIVLPGFAKAVLFPYREGLQAAALTSVDQPLNLGHTLALLIAFVCVASLCVMTAAGIHAIYLYAGPDVQILRVLPYPNLWAPSLFLDMEYTNSLLRLGQPLAVLALMIMLPLVRAVRREARRLDVQGALTGAQPFPRSFE